MGFGLFGLAKEETANPAAKPEFPAWLPIRKRGKGENPCARWRPRCAAGRRTRILGVLTERLERSARCSTRRKSRLLPDPRTANRNRRMHDDRGLSARSDALAERLEQGPGSRGGAGAEARRPLWQDRPVGQHHSPRGELRITHRPPAGEGAPRG